MPADQVQKRDFMTWVRHLDQRDPGAWAQWNAWKRELGGDLHNQLMMARMDIHNQVSPEPDDAFFMYFECAWEPENEMVFKRQNNPVLEGVATTAEEGSILAMLFLGWAAEQDMDKDPEAVSEAAHWYQMAAERSDPLGIIKFCQLGFYGLNRETEKMDASFLETLGRRISELSRWGGKNLFFPDDRVRILEDPVQEIAFARCCYHRYAKLYRPGTVQNEEMEEATQDLMECLSEGQKAQVLGKLWKLEDSLRKNQVSAPAPRKVEDSHPSHRQDQGIPLQKIVDFLVGEFLGTEGINLGEDPIALSRLQDAARKAQNDLLQNGYATVDLPYIAADNDGPRHLHMTFTRDLRRKSAGSSSGSRSTGSTGSTISRSTGSRSIGSTGASKAHKIQRDTSWYPAFGPHPTEEEKKFLRLMERIQNQDTEALNELYRIPGEVRNALELKAEMYFYLENALEGEEDAMYSVGMALLKDYFEEARFWLEPLEKKGRADACGALALGYRMAGSPVNGEKYLKKAAKMGYDPSIESLTNLYITRAQQAAEAGRKDWEKPLEDAVMIQKFSTTKDYPYWQAVSALHMAYIDLMYQMAPELSGKNEIGSRKRKLRSHAVEGIKACLHVVEDDVISREKEQAYAKLGYLCLDLYAADEIIRFAECGVYAFYKAYALNPEDEYLNRARMIEQKAGFRADTRNLDAWAGREGLFPDAPSFSLL